MVDSQSRLPKANASMGTTRAWELGIGSWEFSYERPRR
jgi:hypothetical protein